MSEYFLGINGDKSGPFDRETVVDLLRCNTIDVSSTLIWREGMEDWLPLGQSEFFGESGAMAWRRDSPAAATPPNPPVPVFNPYQAPRTANAPGFYSAPMGGSGRAAYLLGSLLFAIGGYLLAFAVIALTSTAIPGDASEASTRGLAVIIGAMGCILLGWLGTLWLTFRRLDNLGQSRWGVLWMLVPFVSFWLSWRLLACPEGYHQHRKLDTAGKVMTFFYVLPFVIYGLLFAVVFASFLVDAFA